ncbi:FAD-binding oxidoreductase [Mesorhizobium sp.]|uniref:FAD-binding oxidoreductase n=1 Tax=Mesorhizobium sp. TaxID=1871066 RepID=UPI000FEA41EC|nr:FAD-binding oxidoreductase [Mesorhizobium sp.]RWP38421.1 MAG: FAD-binding oxidoreductase [Mesorhizobium sp.]
MSVPYAIHAGDGAPAALLERLASILPRNALLVGDAIDPRYQEDRRGRYSATPRFIARPGTTEEVAACLAACNDFAQPLVVQGGRTGLSGGHRIADGEAVLSTERMSQLGAVQPLTRTVLASAGTPLQAVQEAAEAAGCQFGVDIGARGSATVGGIVATNAGGIRVLKYGMFRAQVAGLETVLADGTVLSALRGLDKDNAGYDLNQLFIGSEGTLGVVTKALLRLHPKPLDEANAFVAVPSVGAALALLKRLRGAVGPGLSAFEIMLPQAYEGVTGFLGMPRPLAAQAPFYVLAEVQSFRDDQAIERFSASLMEGLEEGVAEDAVVSQSPREFQSLWTMRDSCADYVRTRDHIIGGDVSVPLDRIEAFLRASQAAVRRIDPETEFLVFGHLGDGNLHYVIATPKARDAMETVYRMVAESGGSIAAEHGIGIDKKPWLHLSRSAAEIGTMRRLKAALDPKGILNRGRIFDRA